MSFGSKLTASISGVLIADLTPWSGQNLITNELEFVVILAAVFVGMYVLDGIYWVVKERETLAGAIRGAYNE